MTKKKRKQNKNIINLFINQTKKKSNKLAKKIDLAKRNENVYTSIARVYLYLFVHSLSIHFKNTEKNGNKNHHQVPSTDFRIQKKKIFFFIKESPFIAFN